MIAPRTAFGHSLGTSSLKVSISDPTTRTRSTGALAGATVPAGARRCANSVRPLPLGAEGDPGYSPVPVTASESPIIRAR